jgi:hypothetical protein
MSMTRLRCRPVCLVSMIGVLVLTAGWLAAVSGGEGPSSDERRDLERARREVRLLDDIYKTAIVLITEHYVDEDSDLPAGEAFQALFAGMKDKGWHEVRLLDAAGEPLNDNNAPRDAFERSAVKALVAGQPTYEEQVEKDGKTFLRSATPIPIVMDKCKMCHANYADQKVIGALSYTLPLMPPAHARELSAGK